MDKAVVTESSKKLSESFDRNIFQTCFGRSVSRCSNVIHQELQILDNSVAPVSQIVENRIFNVENSGETVVEPDTAGSVRDIHQVLPEVSVELESEKIHSTSLNKEQEINNSQDIEIVKSEFNLVNSEENKQSLMKENNTNSSTVSNDLLNLDLFINAEDNKELTIKEENNADLSKISNELLNLNLNNEEPSQSFYSVPDDKSETGNMSVLESISISSSTSAKCGSGCDQMIEPEIINQEDERKECSENDTQMDINDTKDLKVALKNVEERYKEKKSKRLFEMPDLRPTVKKNNHRSEENIPLAVEDICNNVELTRSIRRKIVPKKDDVDLHTIGNIKSIRKFAHIYK